MMPDLVSARVRAALLDGDSADREVASLCAELLNGRRWIETGVMLLDGVPAETEVEACHALRTLSQALGTLLPQDGAGQTVRTVRYRGVAIGEGATGRYSDSREGGQLHTDGPHRVGQPPDLFALLCVRQSTLGGALVLVEAGRVVAALDPDTVEVLRRSFLFDQREEGAEPVPRRVLRASEDGHWQFTYLRQYIEAGHHHHNAPALTLIERAALDQLDAVLDRLAEQDDGHRRIRLQPGQMVIVDNRRLLHGRTAFADGRADHGRLVLRTWIHLSG
jgi:alpha-ketoglutarate-dependent taurine dioxygenase